MEKNLSFYKKYEKIMLELRRVMQAYRYEHSIGVMHTAAALAMRFGEDIEKAMLAGLLHDATKHLSKEEHILICKQNSVELLEADLLHSGVLHSITGPIIAQNTYSVDDKAVLSAIRWHTTGKGNMTELEMILFIADFIEGGRRFKYDSEVLNKARFYAFNQDLNSTTAYIVHEILNWLKKENASIHYFTEDTDRYYQKYLPG